MTTLAELTGTVTVTEDGSPSLLGDVEITDANPFWFVLDVDARAAVALAQRFQQLGVGIRINGTPIPDREIGKVLTITESRDSYGDRLVFQLIGERWSPFSGRAILRSKAHVEVFFVIGNTAAEFRKKVFDGYVVSHTFNGAPPSATVTCLDAAARHAQKRLKTWTLPANSGRSRLSIGLELLGLCDIPTGHIDLGGDGGAVRKALAPGNQPTLDFVRDLWGILGAEIGFEFNLLCARRYTPSLPPALDINPGVILGPPKAPHGITAPDTLAPNVTGVVSVSFTQEEIGGLRTVETSVVTVGPYAPMSATGNWQLTTRVISEVITRTTYLGTLDILTEQEEFGWYAVRAADLQVQAMLDPPGYEIVPHAAFQRWTFPDGSTRGDSVERYRRLRKSVTRKDVDADHNVIGTRHEEYAFHFIRAAVWEVVDGDDEPRIGTFINDEGEGVLGGREVMGLLEGDNGNTMEGGLNASSLYHRPDILTETVIALAADGTIASETTTEHFYDVGQQRRRANGAYGYGVDNIQYASRSAEALSSVANEWGGERITTRRYRVINEDSYEASERITASNAAPRSQPPHTLPGAPPRPERAEPTTTSQEIKSVIEDRERIFLAGEEIEKIEHNEFVESSAEAALYARVLARRAGVRVLTCSVPIESLAHKFRMARVNLPGSSIHGLRFYITEVTRDAASFVEGIVAEYYPPELD